MHRAKMWGSQNDDSTGDHERVKLEHKLRQMWRLIGWSVGTHLSLCFCLFDCWLSIESSWYHYPWCMLSYCIHLRHGHTNYIDWSSCLSSHIDSSCCMTTLLTLTCTFFSCCLSHSSWHGWFSWLYIIMIVMEHTILARYLSRLACV